MHKAKRGGFTTYSLEYVVLGLLMAGPKHGYGLYHDFTQAFDRIWSAEQAKFYVVLAALEDRGYLEVTTELQDKRPPRKVYHITETGRVAFMRWLWQPVTSMRAVRVEFIARLRLLSLLEMEGADKMIDQQIAALQVMLDEWERDASQQQQTESDLIRLWVEDFRIRQAKFMIEWLAACKESVSESRPVP